MAAAAAAAARHSPAAALLSRSPPSANSSASASLRLFPRRLPSLRISLPFSSAPGRHRRRGGPTMMDTAASSYASALADVAKSNGTLDATAADVETVERIFADRSVQSFFANPTISYDKKIAVISEIASDSELKPHTANFLKILLDMKRIDIIKDIAKEFEIAYNKITGTEVAVVSSVVKLESSHLAQIAKTVQRFTGAQNVRIKTEIDKSLVAGFTIRFGSSGSKLIDMSVKKQLEEIASQLDFSDITLV